MAFVVGDDGLSGIGTGSKYLQNSNSFSFGKN
jgi:hypothetical protein